MRAYLKEELEQFLRAVDAALERRVEVILIGGAAAALHYGATRPTRDIDTWNTIHEDLAHAAKRARLSLELETLVGCFETEMSPIGDPARIRGNFLAVVERVFPASVDRVAQRGERARQ